MADEVYGYLANCLGFHEPGRLLLREYLMPRARKAGITPLEPFELCGPHAPVQQTEATDSYTERQRLWSEFSREVVQINEETMRRCKLMIPVLDGSREADEGIADEMRFFFDHGLGPIYALRTDFRLSENLGCAIHPHLESVVKRSGGEICASMEQWFKEMNGFYRRLRGE